MRGMLISTLGVATAALMAASSAHAGEAKLGFSGWSVGYLPTAIAIERMAERGHTIEAIELGGNNNQLQAAATGAIDITAIAQVMDAIDQGLNSRFFLEANTNEFLLVSADDIATCEDLEGRSLAIHSVGSFVGQLVLQWLDSTCPDVEPAITVIDGSDARLAALIAGQIDSSVIDLQDWALLSRQFPDRFTITSDYTKTIPIMRAAFAAREEFIAANPELIQDWIDVHLDVYGELYENPQILVDKGLELLPEIDPEALPDIVAGFVWAEVWPRDGGLSDDGVQATIDFFNNDGEPFASITSPADVVDRTNLDVVLANR